MPSIHAVGIIPTYSNASQMLTRVEFTPEIQSEVIIISIIHDHDNTFPRKHLKYVLLCVNIIKHTLDLTYMHLFDTQVISGDISGPVLNYFPAFLSSNGLFYSTSVSSQSSEGPFNYTVDVLPELCSSSTNINVSVSAANRVGRGFPSDVQTIGMSSCW